LPGWHDLPHLSADYDNAVFPHCLSDYSFIQGVVALQRLGRDQDRIGMNTDFFCPTTMIGRMIDLPDFHHIEMEGRLV